MQVSIQTTGLEKVQKQLRMLSEKGIKEASAKAINDTAYEVKLSLVGRKYMRIGLIITEPDAVFMNSEDHVLICLEVS